MEPLSDLIGDRLEGGCQPNRTKRNLSSRTKDDLRTQAEPLKFTTLKHLIKILPFDQKAKLMRAGLNTEFGEEKTHLLKEIVDDDYDINLVCGYCKTPETQPDLQIRNKYIVVVDFCDTCNKYVCSDCGIRIYNSEHSDSVLCLKCNKFECFACNSTSPVRSRFDGSQGINLCDECGNFVCDPCENDCGICKRCTN